MSYKILSLDGGGSWALIQVLALAKIYGINKKGHEILSNFDMIAANSGGSLVLGGLIENMSLFEILSLFEDEKIRTKIFSPTKSFFWKIFGKSFGPKYSTEAKLPAILEAFPSKGNIALTQVANDIVGPNGKNIHVLIIAFNYYRNRATFFRSTAAVNTNASTWGIGHSAGLVTLAECVHASSTAPINYFDAPASFSSTDLGELYWDGGVTGNNNPVLAAVVEAIVLGHDPSELLALSIGTGSVALPLADDKTKPSVLENARSKSSFINDVKKIASSILDDPPDAATYIAHVITGFGQGVKSPAISRVVRMNPLICPIKVQDKWAPPAHLSAEQFNFLANINLDAILPQQIEAIKNYALQWLENNARNQPIRMDGKTLACEIGYENFSHALAAWNALTAITEHSPSVSFAPLSDLQPN